MGKVLLTPSEEIRVLLRESRHFRKKLAEGNSFSASDVSREVDKIIPAIENLAHLHLVGANIDRRLKSLLRREVRALIEGAIEAARKLEPTATS